jgi:raffinose/stachyose/melibiose transport system substrate-binding protein
MRKDRRRFAGAGVTAFAVAALAVGAGAGSVLAQDTVLRIAMGQPGENVTAVFEDIATQFEAAHPGVDVQVKVMDAFQYEQIGLPTLLAGPNAPDIYFEWTGSRMAQRDADGYAADLSEYVASGPLAGLWDEGVWPAATVDGKIVLVPHTQDVTNVLWYNVPLLAEHGVTPPTTWDELLAACDVLVAAGVTPIITGNQEPWAPGNWLSHLASRVVGEELYDATLTGPGAFATPEWEAALGYITQLRDHSCVGENSSALVPDDATARFFNGAAAMYPLGGWIVNDAPADLDYDFVNLPAMPAGSAGDQASVMGVETGYMVNAHSPNIPLAVEFLALMNDAGNVQRFIDQAELLPITKSASAGVAPDSLAARLAALLNNAPTIVLPPDTGYDPQVGERLYEAEVAVLDGVATPAEALGALDETLGR